jgi:N-acetylneuraminate synthase/sialic acid synthase
MTIDGVKIDDASDAYVIAEIGHNHQGSIEKAEELLRSAKYCGAHAVKLQKRDNRSLYTQDYYDRPYENENSFGATYGAHREALEFGKPEYQRLLKLAGEIGITVFSTAFDIPSADFLAELDMPAYKIASGDLRNTPLIRYVAKIGKPVILSTGASTLEDVKRAYNAAREVNDAIAVLQCTASYPAKFEEIDLNVISTYRKEFPDAVIGLSAHDNGIVMAVAAYMLGGRIVEKHFTLDRAMKGTDHAFSLEPLGLKKMVRDLQNTRLALGSEEKKIYKSEHPALDKMGKKLVAAHNLSAGQILTEKDIGIKSPGGGVMPYDLDRLIGQKISHAMKKDDAFAIQDLKK